MHAVDLKGQIALVAAGGSGLGRAMATEPAQAGADIVIASRNLDACEEVARTAEAFGVTALPVSCHTGDTWSIAACPASPAA